MPMQSTWRRFTLTLLAGIGLLTNARADQITFKNGDRLSGSIVKVDEKQVVFKSEFAGEITAPRDSVTEIVSSNSVVVGLKGGQVLAGTLNLAGSQARVATTDAGTVTALGADVVSIRSKEEQLAYETEIDRYRNPRLIDLWTGFVDLGVAESRGNARTSTVNTGARASRTTSRDRIGVHFTSIYASNSTTGISLITANALRGGITYDLNITPKMFGFGTTELEYDEFQSLDLRFAPAGGLGYHVWKGERGYFDLMGGASLNREFFSTGLNRTSGEALLAQETSYKVNSRMALQQKLAVYPNITDRGNYRMNFDLSAVTALWKWFGWQFSFSDRLLSNPVPGRRKNDALFTTGLRLTFAK